MANTATVKIWNKEVGAIAWDPLTGVGTFEFDAAFIKNNWDLAPIKMPVNRTINRTFSFSELSRSNTFQGLPGLLADVLPDKYGNTLIDAWLAREGRPSGSLNPVEKLLFMGKRGMGALEFEPPDKRGTNTSTNIELNSLVQVANDILNKRIDFSTNLSSNVNKKLIDILKIGTSAGGARAKAVIAYNPVTGKVKSGQAEAPEGFTHWLIKFDGVQDLQFGDSKGYGRVEMAYYLMAKDAEIEMAECRLFEENDRAHFMTRRFDRDPNTGKLHFQSFCAMQHFDFNDVNSYSYEQLFETMRLLGLTYPQAEQLFRRMVFNVIARNCDDHTKNFAFIMDKNGIWKLSPAYDLCYSYNPDSLWVSQQSLSVNGKRKNIKRYDLLAVAKHMNIKKAANIIAQINDIVSKWSDYAEQTKVNIDLHHIIKKNLININN
ncbi:MAG: type II toxin-antitoxin system HipA family toxin [Bacteroidetes bacterium]|nr:type II toxin-antitoxin system HipA family toxin [Bacteroidota bacterium]